MKWCYNVGPEVYFRKAEAFPYPIRPFILETVRDLNGSSEAQAKEVKSISSLQKALNSTRREMQKNNRNRLASVWERQNVNPNVFGWHSNYMGTLWYSCMLQDNK